MRYYSSVRKRMLVLTGCFLIVMASGCGKNVQGMSEPDTIVTEVDTETGKEAEDNSIEQRHREEEKSVFTIASASETVAALYQDIYESAVSAGMIGSLKVTEDIMDRLGENGYVATDVENKNRLNMTNSNQLEQFCKSVAKQEDNSISVFSIAENGGFIRFDLETTKGNVEVTRSVLNWEKGKPVVGYSDSYEASNWNDTADGYLFFEKELPAGYDGAPGYTAMRIRQLDDKCLTMNQKYIAPIGYGANNLFLTDWSETDFADLNFYDLFDILYSDVYRQATPYVKEVNAQTYLVPRQEFETVIQSYFQIDSQTLQKKTTFLQDTGEYQYQARGFYDSGMAPDMPYPEVIDCIQNEDATFTLTVSAVWPKEGTDRAFSHEVVIRELSDGSFQYVSNHVIPSEENREPDWYTNRLSQAEWEILE